MNRLFSTVLPTVAGLLFIAILSGCIGNTAMQVRGGSLQLNARLRADMLSADGMDNGRFYADGQCEATNVRDECRFISPLRASMVSQLDSRYLHRLRRSTYFWVEGDGYSILSYEFMGKGLSIVDADEPTTVIAGGGPEGIDIGTCYGFPALSPETRLTVPGLETAVIAQSNQFLAQFDVNVRECAAGSTAGISETLTPQTGNCGNRSVRSLFSAVPPGPQTVPLCLINLPATNLLADISYTLTPQAAAGADLQSAWPGLALGAFPLLPHLKTVPVDGTRTLSRRLTRTGEIFSNDDGSMSHVFTWKVPLENSIWSENFSPNLAVSRARVRRGPWTSGNHDYIELEYLKVAGVRCQVRAPNTNNIDFDIPQCEPSREGTFRVTPAYTFDALNAGKVDDGARIEWEVRVRVPPRQLADTDVLFLELDLTAISPIGSSGSGLVADPGGRNLGQIRTGPASGALPAFTLRNYGPLSAWLESVTFTGRDAAEFGTPDIQRVGAAAGAASLTTPLIFSSGSTLQLNVRPAFQTVGVKQANMAIRFHDVSNRVNTIYLALDASAVSPFMSVLPASLHFNAVPGVGGYAQAQRGALMSNDGPIPFQRLTTRIVGSNATDFRVLYADYGLGRSNLAQPLTLDPGSAELYRMGFYPTAAGDREATLLIDTSEGTQSVALHGHCNEHCEQQPPLPAAEPRKVPTFTPTKVPRLVLRKSKLKAVPKLKSAE